MQYRVYLQQMASVAITVEADSREEAMDKAYDQAPGGLCAHCAGAFSSDPGIDLSGDWEIANEDEDVVEVTA